MKIITTILFALLVLTAVPTSHASQLYQFEQDGSGTVIATMELAQVPANDVSHLTSFKFTAAGDATFALGTGELENIFNFFGGSAGDNGGGGLVGTGVSTGFLSSDSPPIPSDLTNYPGFLTSNTF